MIELHLLGDVSLLDAGRPSGTAVVGQPKRLAILAYLCLEGHGAFVRRDALLSLFWPDLTEERARADLSQSLYVLRRALGVDVIPGRGTDEIGVDATRLWCDVVAFRESLDRGDRRRALELYGGTLLPALHLDNPELEHWLDGERTALRSAALKAAIALGDDAVDAVDWTAASAWYRRALEIVPESEGATRGLVKALWMDGYRTAALDVYERFAEHLETGYGVAPGPELRSLIQRVRVGERRGRERLNETLPTEAAGRPGVGPNRQPEPRTAVLRRAVWARERARVVALVAVAAVTVAAFAIWPGGSSGQSDDEWLRADRRYRQGMAAFFAGHYDSARVHLKDAVEIDSTHARAWSLLGYVDVTLNASELAPSMDVLPEAYRAARRSVELDSTSAEAWAALAMSETVVRRDLGAGLRGLRRALALSSTGGITEALIRADLSTLLADLRRCDEARDAVGPDAARPPLERPLGSATLLRVLYLCRDYRAVLEEADRSFSAGESSLELHRYVFLSRLLDNDPAGAELELSRMRQAYPEHPVHAAHEVLLLSRRGDLEAARARLADVQRIPAQATFAGVASPVEAMAQLFTAVGDSGRAFALLTEAVETWGHAHGLSSDPLFDPLRGDDRYYRLLVRVGFHCRRGNDLQVCRPLH